MAKLYNLWIQARLMFTLEVYFSGKRDQLAQVASQWTKVAGSRA